MTAQEREALQAARTAIESLLVLPMTAMSVAPQELRGQAYGALQQIDALLSKAEPDASPDPTGNP